MKTILSENIFDIFDENNDDLEYTNNELDQYYLSGHLNSMLIDEEPMDDMGMIDMLDVEV